METLRNAFFVLMVVAPYAMLFYREISFRARLLFVCMLALAVLCAMWLAVYCGLYSILPVAYGYSAFVSICTIVNLSVIIISWLVSKLAGWFD